VTWQKKWGRGRVGHKNGPRGYEREQVDKVQQALSFLPGGISEKRKDRQKIAQRGLQRKQIKRFLLGT